MVASGWIIFVQDPLGGEPTALIRIDRTKTGLNPKDVAVADIKKPKPAEDPRPEEAAPGEQVGEDGQPLAATEPGAAPAPRRRPIQRIAEGQPLSSAPVPKVTEKGRQGPLPKVAPDGTRPLDIYARPAPALSASQSRLVMVVTGLGLSQTGTQDALKLLPPGITLAFAPYGSSLERWMQKARQDGHELLMQVPMEPFDFPDNDPGPQTLLTSLTPEQNVGRLQWAMSRVTNYVGIMNYTGAKYTAASEAMAPMMKELNQRGLMFLDDGSSSRSMAENVAQGEHVPFARADMTIDSVASESAIDSRLSQLENLARSKGLAIGVASSLPLSVKRIAEWSKALEARGVILIPVSAAIKTGQM